MFKSRMSSSGIDKVAVAKLFNVSQSLKLWAVDDLQKEFWQLNMAVYWIVEYLKNSKSES